MTRCAATALEGWRPGSSYPHATAREGSGLCTSAACGGGSGVCWSASQRTPPSTRTMCATISATSAWQSIPVSLRPGGSLWRASPGRSWRPCWSPAASSPPTTSSLSTSGSSSTPSLPFYGTASPTTTGLMARISSQSWLRTMAPSPSLWRTSPCSTTCAGAWPRTSPSASAARSCGSRPPAPSRASTRTASPPPSPPSLRPPPWCWSPCR
mmetsp:Transcript_18502/g.51829  ORF Transcript_18502/g.51829 Transcript_18502/m.51829 type:complete len:211 (+) Transcript_18502:286-918(+)